MYTADNTVSELIQSGTVKYDMWNIPENFAAGVTQREKSRYNYYHFHILLWMKQVEALPTGEIWAESFRTLMRDKVERNYSYASKNGNVGSQGTAQELVAPLTVLCRDHWRQLSKYTFDSTPLVIGDTSYQTVTSTTATTGIGTITSTSIYQQVDGTYLQVASVPPDSLSTAFSLFLVANTDEKYTKFLESWRKALGYVKLEEEEDNVVERFINAVGTKLLRPDYVKVLNEFKTTHSSFLANVQNVCAKVQPV